MISGLITHLRYLIVRSERGALSGGLGIDGMRDSFRDTYPEAWRIATRIAELLAERIGQPLGDDEVLYIALHVARTRAL